jgi:prepilin-type N-terminal cleavage/methylation domain-containing protein
MASSSFTVRLRSRLRRQRKQTNSGFTLIELLVTVFIASGIISGLLYLVVELLQADQRESTRAETQRELQLALDFISNELQESMYVYPDATAVRAHLPAAELPADFAPVLAFWKQQRFTPSVQDLCATNSTDPQLANVSCETGHSYSLIVYSLARPDDDEQWQGPARIIRSAMTKIDSDDGAGNFTINANYAPPTDAEGQVDLESWITVTPTTPSPFSAEQANVTLVDFVDDGSGAEQAGGIVRGAACPTSPVDADGNPVRTYALSPSDSIDLDGNEVRSFYACVDDSSVTLSQWNQEVIVYLQGNPFGRSGTVANGGFLPALETTVLSRGILNKNPDNRLQP